MNLDRYYNFDWVDAGEQPTDDAVSAEKTMRAELGEGLVKAPLVEPYARAIHCSRPRRCRVFP